MRGGGGGTGWFVVDLRGWAEEVIGGVGGHGEGDMWGRWMGDAAWLAELRKGLCGATLVIIGWMMWCIGIVDVITRIVILS